MLNFRAQMDDESLRRWKEQLLGGVDFNQVKVFFFVSSFNLYFLALNILHGPDIVLEIPNSRNPKAPLFTLKEGSKCNLKFSIKVSNDIGCGFKYTNHVRKTGLKVDNSKEILGTFSPQAELYSHVMPEKVTPHQNHRCSRTHPINTAKTKFVDDDNKCYLELNYTFDIQKNLAK
ncbi:rho GDP-dissociation inhibitor 1-like [Bidens hawaiensis]|uniref:rho GDP-dissociation inhibitor 1-like n=1 Tax=Bidens hawaiensis TaxID=980011 RepID=UPI00404A8CEA